jgi:hypothetical protein
MLPTRRATTASGGRGQRVICLYITCLVCKGPTSIVYWPQHTMPEEAVILSGIVNVNCMHDSENAYHPEPIPKLTC